MNGISRLLCGGWIAALSTTGIASAAPTCFIVSEPAGRVTHGDSFVISLSDPAYITHARDLIARGPDVAGAPIVFATIQPSDSGINRDLLASGKPAWSWEVTAVHGFGDMGVELLDGWPMFVESDLANWLRNTGPQTDDPTVVPTSGEIGFWNYTVTAELPGDGIPNVSLPPAFFAGMIGSVCLLIHRKMSQKK